MQTTAFRAWSCCTPSATVDKPSDYGNKQMALRAIFGLLPSAPVLSPCSRVSPHSDVVVLRGLRDGTLLITTRKIRSA